MSDVGWTSWALHRTTENKKRTKAKALNCFWSHSFLAPLGASTVLISPGCPRAWDSSQVFPVFDSPPSLVTKKNLTVANLDPSFRSISDFGYITENSLVLSALRGSAMPDRKPLDRLAENPDFQTVVIDGARVLQTLVNSELFIVWGQKRSKNRSKRLGRGLVSNLVVIGDDMGRIRGSSSTP